MSECAAPHPIYLDTRETGETIETSSLVGLGLEKAPKPKRLPKPSKVESYQPTLNFADVEDDPETARLIAALHPVLLAASVRPKAAPEGDSSAVAWLESRCRDWRRQNFSAVTITEFVEKAIGKIRPFQVGPVERYIAACLNTAASKQETPVASLKAAQIRPEYQRYVMTPEESAYYAERNAQARNGAKK